MPIEDLKGKILVAKEHTVASAVKLGANPFAAGKYTGERANIESGTVVMCCFYYKPASVEEARRNRQPTWPFLFVLYRDKVWEVVPHAFVTLDASETLQNKSVCFTGANAKSRSYFRVLVTAAGGTNVSGVSKNTSYLVMADKNSNSTKAQNARKFGTPTLTYEEFEKMLGKKS